jgi:hypothetical protein
MNSPRTLKPFTPQHRASSLCPARAKNPTFANHPARTRSAPEGACVVAFTPRSGPPTRRDSNTFHRTGLDSKDDVSYHDVMTRRSKGEVPCSLTPVAPYNPSSAPRSTSLPNCMNLHENARFSQKSHPSLPILTPPTNAPPDAQSHLSSILSKTSYRAKADGIDPFPATASEPGTLLIVL